MFKLSSLIRSGRTGFRLSWLDLIVLSVTIVFSVCFPSSWLTSTIMEQFIHWLIPYIVVNFFLFCNVFRVRTKYELLWSISALIDLYVSIFYLDNILIFFMVQSCFTLIAISFEICSSSYHGIFARRKDSL